MIVLTEIRACSTQTFGIVARSLSKSTLGVLKKSRAGAEITPLSTLVYFQSVLTGGGECYAKTDLAMLSGEASLYLWFDDLRIELL